MSNFGNGLRHAGQAVLGNYQESGLNVTSAIASRCAGAICHSRFYRDDIAACDGPIAVIGLAWSPLAETDRGQFLQRKAHSDSFTILTFGNINTNKCADRVIRAIAASRLLKHVSQYRVVGAIQTEVAAELRDLAASLEVNLVIAGPVDDAELSRELTTATIVSCLREPVLEGSSASAIEALMQGNATIVSDAGFYRELPDNCVIKVPAKTDPESIQIALEQLYSNPDQCENLRRNAREYSRATFTAENYADSLLDLAEEVRATSSYLPMIDRIGAELISLGVRRDAAATEYLLRAIEDMAPVLRRAMDDEQENPLVHSGVDSGPIVR